MSKTSTCRKPGDRKFAASWRACLVPDYAVYLEGRGYVPISAEEVHELMWASEDEYETWRVRLVSVEVKGIPVALPDIVALTRQPFETLVEVLGPEQFRFVG